MITTTVATTVVITTVFHKVRPMRSVWKTVR